MPNEDALYNLWSYTGKDYDLGDFDSFKASMENPEARSSFHKYAGSKFDLGDYSSFESSLGYGQPKPPAAPRLPGNMNPQQVKQFFSRAGKTLTDAQSNDIAGMVSGKSYEEAMSLTSNYLAPKPELPVQEQAPLVAAPQPGTGFTGEVDGVRINTTEAQQPDFAFNDVAKEIARPKTVAETEQNIAQTMIDEYKGADKDLTYIFDAIDNGKLSGADLSPFVKIGMSIFTDVPMNSDIFGYTREQIAAMNNKEREMLKVQIRAQKSAQKTSNLITNFATIKALQEESTKNIANLTIELDAMKQDPMSDPKAITKKANELYDQIILNQVSNNSQNPFEKQQRMKAIAAAHEAVSVLPASVQAYIGAKNAALEGSDLGLSMLNSLGEATNKYSTAALVKRAMGTFPNERITTIEGEFLKNFANTKKEELQAYRESNKTEYLAGQVSILDGLNAVNVGSALGQTLGSMGVVIGASVAGGPIGGITAGYSLVYGDAVDAARKAGYNETESEIYGQILAVGSGMLEELPVGRLLEGWTNAMLKKSVLNTIRTELRAGTPKAEIVKKVADYAFDKTVKGIQQGVPEGVTEVLQGGQEYLTQLAFNNYLKEKEDPGFDIPSLKEFGKQSAEAFVLGFFGGGGAQVVGDVMSGTQSYAKLASSAIRDNETFNNLNLVADGLLASGKITQQERDSFVGNLKIAKEAKAALPKYIKDDNVRQRSIELILEKKRIEADMATVDPSMQDGYKAKLTSIQAELKSIADQKWKAPANPVLFSTLSGLEAMTDALVNDSSRENSAGTFVSTIESGKGFISKLIKSLDDNTPVAKPMIDRTVKALETLAKSFASAPVKTEMTQKAAQQAQELADQIKSYKNTPESIEEAVIPGLDISLVADRIALGVPVADLDFMGDVPADIQEAYQGIVSGDPVSSDDSNNVQNVLYAKYKQLSDIKQRIQDKLENTTSKEKQKKLSESINAITEIQGKLSEDLDMLDKYTKETRINEQATGKTQPSKTKPVVKEEPKKEQAKPSSKLSEEELAEMEYDYSNPSDAIAGLIDEQVDASKIYKLLNGAIKFINKIAPNVKVYVHATSQEFYDSVYSTSGANEHNLTDDAAFVMGNDGKPKAVHFNLEAMLGKKDPKKREEALRTFAHEAMHVGLQSIFGNDQKLFKSFQDKLSKVLKSADLAFLDDFIENYRDPNKQDVTAEEFLAELGGMMSAEGRKIPKPILSRIAQLINNTITAAARTLKIPVDSNLLFKNTNDTNDVIDFFNTMAESTRAGIIQGVQAKSEPLLKQQTKQANEINQPTGARTTARKTDTDTQVLFTVATKRAFDIGTKILKGYTEKYDDLVKMEYKEVFKMGADKFNKLFNETANYALVNYTEILKSNIPRYKAKLNVGMPFLGSWEGFYEPSMNLNISISDDTDTSKLSDLFNLISEKTSQDAYIVEMVSDLDDAFQKDPNKLQLYEYQGNGISVYPQVIAKFPREITPFERSKLAQKMTEAKFDSFSIGPDFVKISVFDNGISDDENTDREKEREDRIAFFNDQKSIFEKAVKGNNLYSQGVKFSTQIKRSAFVAGKKTGENELQRKYDRRDVFEAFKPSNAGSTTRARKSGEPGPARGNRLFNQPLAEASAIASKYYESKIGGKTPVYTGTRYLDTENSKRISDAFIAMKHDPQNLEVAKAYRQMIKETIDQFEAIVADGYSVVINNKEPYASSADMIDDLRNNKSLNIFSTESGFGDAPITEEQRRDNPLLAKTKYKDANGVPLLANDLFRFVHDFFGHAKLGNSFGAKGEENAWNVHARMYTPLARRAMTTETRGQNSYVNFSGVNDDIKALQEKGIQQRKNGDLAGAEKTSEKIIELMKFADQKVGLLPEEFSQIDETNEGDRHEELGLPAPKTGESTTRARKAAEKTPKNIEERVGREGGLVNGTDLQLTGKEKIKPGKTTFTIYEAPTEAQKAKGVAGKMIKSYSLEDIKGKKLQSNSAIVNRAEMLSSGVFTYKYDELDENNEKTGKKLSGEYPLPYSNPKANKAIKQTVQKIKSITSTSKEAVAEKEKLNAKLKKEVISVYEGVIDTMSQNIRALFDTLTPEFIEQSKRWYEGANRFANSLANKYNVSVEQGSGILAVLSPQKDWFNNVSAAERVMDIITNHSDKPFTKELLDNAVEYNLRGKKQEPKWVTDIKKQFKSLEGMSINDMQKNGISELSQANLLRVLDHYYNSPNVLQTTPDGKVIGYGDGTIMWNPAAEIARAIMIFRDPSQSNIDVLLGEGNKVRNFYNNIVDPNSEDGYLTADTHALGVAFGLPTSANDASAFKLFGGGESSIYASVKDAYTKVSNDLGMLPRELQSITWEAFRTGVNDKDRTKAKNKSNFDMMLSMMKQGIGPYTITQSIINENRSTDPEWAKELGISTQKPVSEIRQGAKRETEQAAGEDGTIRRQQRERDGGADTSVVPDATRETVTRARKSQSDKQYYNPAQAADQGTKADRDNQVKIYDQAKEFIDNYLASGGEPNDLQTGLYIYLSDNGIDIDANDLFQLRYDVTQGNRPKFGENKGGKGYAQQEGTETKRSRVINRIKTKLEKLGTDKRLNRRIVDKLKESLHYTVENQEDAMKIAQMVVDEFGGIDGPQDVQDLFDLSNEFSGAVKTFIVGNVLNEAYKNAKKAEKGSAEQLAYQNIVNAASSLLAERARENGREIAALYKLYLNSPEGMYTIEAKRFLQDVERAFKSKSQKANIDALLKELKGAKDEAARLALEVDAVKATIAAATGGPVTTPPPSPSKPPKPPKPQAPPSVAPTPTQQNLKKERSLFKQLKDRLSALGNTRARRQYAAGVDAEVVDILSELARVNFERGIFEFNAIKDVISKKLAKDNLTISDDHYTEMWNDIWREAGSAQVAFNAEILAKRIVAKAKMTQPSAPMTDPIKLIKDELFKRATEDIEDFEVTPETEFDKLKSLLIRYSTMTKPIWTESKAAVERQIEALDPTKYSPAAKAELRRKLDRFFNDTLANALPRSQKKITATFTEEVKSKQFKIQEVLLKPNDVISNTKEEFVSDLVDKLVSQTGVGYSEARAIAEAFSKEYDAYAQKTTEKILARSVPRTKSKEKIFRKSSAEKAFEMIKYGAIDANASITDKDGNLTDLNLMFAEIFGLPQMTAEIRDNLKAFAEQIAKTKPNSVVRQQFYNDMMMYIEFQKIRDSMTGDILMAQIYNNVLLSMDTMMKAFNSNIVNMPFEFITQTVRAAVEGDFSLIPLLAKSYFGRKGERRKGKKGTEVYFREGFNNAKMALAGMVENEYFSTVNTAEVLSRQSDSPALRAWGKYARKSGRFLGAIDTLLTAAATNARISDLMYDEIKYLANLNGKKLTSREISAAVAKIQGVSGAPVKDAIAQATDEFVEAYGPSVDINSKGKIRLFRARVMEIIREGSAERAADYISSNGWASELDAARIDEITTTAKELASKIGLVGTPPGTWGVMASMLKSTGEFLPGSQVILGNLFVNAPMNAAEKILQGNSVLGLGVLAVRLMKNQRGILNGKEQTLKLLKGKGIRTEMYGRVTSKIGPADVNMEKKEMIARFVMVQATLLPITIMATSAIIGAIGKGADDEEKENILKDGVSGVGKISENKRHLIFFGDKTAEPGTAKFEGQWKDLGFYVTGPMYGYTAPGAYAKMSALKSMYGIEPYSVYSNGRLLMRYNDNPLLASVLGSVGANNDILLFNNDPEKPTETYTQMIMQSTFLQLNLVKDQAAIKPVMEWIDAAAGTGSYATPDLDNIKDRGLLLLSKKGGNLVSNLMLPAEAKNFNQDIKSLIGASVDDPRAWQEFMLVRAPIMDLLIENEKTDSFGFPIEEKTKRVLPVGTQGLLYVRGADGALTFPQVDQIMNGPGGKYYAMFKKYDNDRFDKPGISDYVERDPNNSGNSKVVSLTIDQRNEVRDEYKKIMREFCDQNYESLRSGTKNEFNRTFDTFLAFYGGDIGGYKDYILKKVIGENAFVNETIEESIKQGIDEEFGQRD